MFYKLTCAEAITVKLHGKKNFASKNIDAIRTPSFTSVFERTPRFPLGRGRAFEPTSLPLPARSLERNPYEIPLSRGLVGRILDTFRKKKRK